MVRNPEPPPGVGSKFLDPGQTNFILTSGSADQRNENIALNHNLSIPGCDEDGSRSMAKRQFDGTGEEGFLSMGCMCHGVSDKMVDKTEGINSNKIV